MADNYWDQFEEVSEESVDTQPASTEDSYWNQFEEEPKEGGKTEAFIGGLGQGATLGFMDELSATAQQQMARSEGEEPSEDEIGMIDPSPVGFLTSAVMQRLGYGTDAEQDEYQKELENQRQIQQELQQAQPEAYLAGELSSAVIPGAGLAKAAKAPTMATKLTSAASTGAKVGGISGAGLSEADLAEGEYGELAQDVALGTGAGAALGASLPVAGQAAKKLASEALPAGGKLAKGAYEMVKDVPLMGQFTEGAVESAKGKFVLGQRDKIGKELVEEASRVAKQMSEAYGDVGKRMAQEIEEATARGDTVSVKRTLDLAEEILPKFKEITKKRTSDKGEIQDLLSSLKDKEISPELAREVEQEFQDLAYGKGMRTKRGESAAQRITGELSQDIAPEGSNLRALKDESMAYREALESLGLKGTESELQSAKKLAPQLQRLASETQAGDITRETMKKSIESIKKVNPELAADIEKSVIQASEKFDLAKNLQKGGVFEKGAGAAGQIIGITLRPITKIYSMSKNALSQLAQKARTVSNGGPAANKVIEALENAVNKQEDSARNAALFSILQNPQTRLFMKEKLGFELDNNNSEEKE